MLINNSTVSLTIHPSVASGTLTSWLLCVRLPPTREHQRLLVMLTFPQLPAFLRVCLFHMVALTLVLGATPILVSVLGKMNHFTLPIVHIFKSHGHLSLHTTVILTAVTGYVMVVLTCISLRINWW